MSNNYFPVSAAFQKAATAAPARLPLPHVLRAVQAVAPVAGINPDIFRA